MEKCVCGSDYKGFHTDWEQPGLQKDRSRICYSRGHRGAGLCSIINSSQQLREGADGASQLGYQGSGGELLSVGRAGWVMLEF